jgi:hypothetical protein
LIRITRPNCDPKAEKVHGIRSELITVLFGKEIQGRFGLELKCLQFQLVGMRVCSLVHKLKARDDEHKASGR